MFQALINDILRDFLNRFVFVYLDNILIFPHDQEEHQSHVRQVLQRLLENKLFKAGKCDFHASSVSFLGYILEAGQVKADPSKIQAMVDWLVPNSWKQLQRFLGFANFNCRFIRDYSWIAAPLNKLMSSCTLFHWTPEASAAFIDLKQRFTTALVLIPTHSVPIPTHSQSHPGVNE